MMKFSRLLANAIMLPNVSRWTLTIILILGIILLKTGRTSADLTAQKTVHNSHFKATTVNLSDQNTANLSSLSTLFNTTGFVPGGFDIKSIKIVSTGEQNFNYAIKVESPGQTSQLCLKFSLKVMKNWIEIYNGPLLSFQGTSTFPDSNNEDWVFILKLTENDDAIKNANCTFNILARTWKNNPSEDLKGFWSKKLLTNIVTTGSW